MAERAGPEAAGLYYERHGAADTPPLILSSGLGGSANYWRPNIAALAAHYHVITYDHRGTGRSDRALPDAISVEDFADDILALMDATGIQRAHIIGHAAGGVAGLALALKAPERIDKLIVVNGWAKADPHFLRCFEARLNLLRHAGVEAFLRAQPIFLYPPDWISRNTAALDAELPHQASDFPGAATMEKRIAALAAFDITARLDDLKATIMMTLVASDDHLVPPLASQAFRDLPGVQMAGMTGGHACNVTDPDTFNRIILDFLGE